MVRAAFRYMALKRIACFVDHSDLSVSGARLAAAIAARSGAHLVLVMSTETPLFVTSVGGEIAYMPPAVSEAVSRRDDRDANQRLDELAADLRQITRTPVSQQLLHGAPIEALLEFVDSSGIDLLVVGGDEPGFFQRLLHRSVPETVARQSLCPVLVLGAEREIHAPICRALVAVDYSDQSRAAAMLASQIVGFDGTLDFVHVWEQAVPFATSGVEGMQADPTLEDDLESLRSRHVEQLGQFVESLPIRQELIGRLFVDIGVPSEEITRRADEVAADVIVTGSHRHEDWGDKLFGTTADRLIEEYHRPVLTVPTAAATATARADSEAEAVDEQLDETFPASDPPSWWGGR